MIPIHLDSYTGLSNYGKLMQRLNSTRIKIKSGVLRGSALFFCLFLCLLFNADLCHAFKAKVRYVIDGDTFVLDNNKHVRLASIDTPEIGRDGKPDQFYARESTAILKKLIGGKIVRIDYAAGREDRYKRIIGWVYVDGVPVNEYMILKGAAYFYYHKGNSARRQDKLLQVQKKAYKKKVGFWSVLAQQRQFRETWIGNKRSRRCFLEGDKFGQRISKKNRVYFSNLGQAFNKGYSPARNSGFWPVAE